MWSSRDLMLVDCIDRCEIMNSGQGVRRQEITKVWVGSVTDDHVMHIGEVADRAGLSLRTIRHYDEIGLVAPSGRTDGGFRLYSPADLGRLVLIKNMKPLGYSLEQMSELLSVIDSRASGAGAGAEEALEAFRQDAAQRRERLVVQLAKADEFIAELGSV